MAYVLQGPCSMFSDLNSKEISASDRRANFLKTRNQL